MSRPDHIKGASWSRLLSIPSQFSDAFFVGWTVTSQIRDPSGKLIAEVQCEWLDAATTRDLLLSVNQTDSWPSGDLLIDIKFTRNSDGHVLKTTTARFLVGTGVTE